MKPTFLGIDYGDRFIGLALGTDALAVPLQVIEHSPGLEKTIARIAQEHAVQTVVIGMPTSMSGHRNERVQATERFITRLKKVMAVPVVMIDERLSTKEAAQQMDRTRHDANAAALILQTYLDARSSTHPV